MGFEFYNASYLAARRALTPADGFFPTPGPRLPFLCWRKKGARFHAGAVLWFIRGPT